MAIDTFFFALSDAELTVIQLSLKVAGAAMVFVLPIAFLVGFCLARYRFPGQSLLNALVLMPLVLPPVVTGYLLLVLLAPNAPVGAFLRDAFGLEFAFRWTGAALAAGVMAFPLMVRPIRQSIEAIDARFEPTARSLGAGRFMTFVTITLPLSLPGLLAGVILGFAKALGEFGATITFVSNIPGETSTLPLAIYSFLQVPGGDLQVWRLTFFSVVLAVVAVLLSEFSMRRLRAWSGGDRP